MAYSRNTRPKKRSGGLFIMLVGLALVGLHFYNTRFTATPREKLTMVTGLPVNPTITAIHGRFGVTTGAVLKFTVQGQTVEYGSTNTGYAGLLQAVQRGAILTLGVAPNEEALLSREGWGLSCRWESRCDDTWFDGGWRCSNL
jgi:hypothetical protein